MGESHFVIFPENPTDPTSSGPHSLRHSFDFILQHKYSHSLPLVRYDIPDTKGGFLEKHWKSVNAPVRGSGVGLSIAQKIVESHGGYIRAESSPGEGATFSVFLPAE